MPVVSIICPTWNRAYCLASAIRSVIDQTFKDWELIIVDDGSTDNTERVVRSFADTRIRYYKTAHRGVGHARNYGIRKSHGGFITCQDSDDVSLPDRLEKLLPYVKKFDVVYSGLYVRSHDKEHNTLGRAYLPAKKLNIKHLLREQYIPGPSIFKREVWEQKPYREEVGIADDWMAYLDWALSGFSFKAVDIGLYEYIRNWDSGTLVSVNDGTQKKLFNVIKRITQDEYAETVGGHANIQ